jgi:hypothetical protein
VGIIYDNGCEHSSPGTAENFLISRINHMHVRVWDNRANQSAKRAYAMNTYICDEGCVLKIDSTLFRKQNVYTNTPGTLQPIPILVFIVHEIQTILFP